MRVKLAKMSTLRADVIASTTECSIVDEGPGEEGVVRFINKRLLSMCMVGLRQKTRGRICADESC